MNNAFVTGGSRGIGRAIVLKYVNQGWGCAFTYSSNKEQADETIKLAKEINPEVKIKAYQMQVQNAGEVETVAEQVINDFDDITAVVNNAAIVRNNAAVLMSNEEWDTVIATNLSGAFYVVRSFLMHLISNKKGRIINISSIAAKGCSGQVNYAASKAGLIGLTKTLAKEYGSKNITSNIVTVGFVETGMTKDHMAESLRKFWLTWNPMKRVGKAEEIADMVYFLSSEQGSFINGEEIIVAGGLTYPP